MLEPHCVMRYSLCDYAVFAKIFVKRANNKHAIHTSNLCAELCQIRQICVLFAWSDGRVESCRNLLFPKCFLPILVVQSY